MNDPQPVHDADLYLFRSVLLNWPDNYVVKFLRQLIPALKTGARVVINEGALPKPGEVGMWDEKIVWSLDLCMMAMFNSKERTVEEWEGLFAEADPRFKFLGARRPGESLLWIMEAVWDADGEVKAGVNGLTNGVANGETNGVTNVETNGEANGLTNGHTVV